MRHFIFSVASTHKIGIQRFANLLAITLILISNYGCAAQAQPATATHSPAARQVSPPAQPAYKRPVFKRPEAKLAPRTVQAQPTMTAQATATIVDQPTQAAPTPVQTNPPATPTQATGPGKIVKLPPPEVKPMKQSQTGTNGKANQSAQTLAPGGFGSTLIAGGGTILRYPVAAYSATRHEFLAVWVDGSSLRGRLLDSNGTPLATEFTVASQSVGTPEHLEMAYSPTSDSYMVIWSELNGGISTEYYCAGNACTSYSLAQSNLYALSISGDGSASGGPGLVTNKLTVFGTARPGYDLVYNSQENKYLVAWQQPRGAIVNGLAYPTSIYARTVGVDGSPQGSSQLLVTAVWADIRLGYSSGSNSYLVIYAEADPDLAFSVWSHVQLFSSGLQPSSAITTIYNADVPHVTYLPAENNFLIAWEYSKYGPYNSQVHAQKFSGASGTPSGPEVIFLRGLYADYGFEPMVSYNASAQQTFMVASYDGLSGPNLVGQYINNQLGTPIDQAFLPVGNGNINHFEYKVATRR
jgi:hypothetical protein